MTADLVAHILRETEHLGVGPLHCTALLNDANPLADAVEHGESVSAKSGVLQWNQVRGAGDDDIEVAYLQGLQAGVERVGVLHMGVGIQ